MAEPLLVFADVERFLVDRLRDRSELTGVLVDTMPPPGFDGTRRAVLISRVGGAWVDDLRLDQALVELEAFGPDKAAAHATALVARAAVLAVRGLGYPGGRVTDVVEEDGPRWLPDYRHPQGRRYVAVLRVVLAAS
ncbi:MAG TPA: hypothetical protein VHJ17_20020 [Thermomonospora sp.]|nr:hypothetical protein [Thermomonospora sp.]